METIEEIKNGTIYNGLLEQIEELKAQIEKMKNCYNCKHFKNNEDVWCDYNANGCNPLSKKLMLMWGLSE